MQPNGRMKAVAGRSNKISVLIIVAVCILLGTALLWGRSRLHSKNAEYNAQEAQIKESIAEQEERSKQLDKYERYVKSDEFAEKTAREKFGLVGEDEYAVKAGN